MKKIIGIMLSLSLLVGLYTSSLATDINKEMTNPTLTKMQVDGVLAHSPYNSGIILNDVHDGYNYADYESEINRVQAIGQSIQNQKSNTSLYLNVRSYKQDGQVWSNDIMLSANLAIGPYGCTLTSFTMVQSFFGGTYNPRGVNNILGNNASPFNYTGAASNFNYSILLADRTNRSYANASGIIIGALNDYSKPVIVGLTHKTTGATHFVVATGFSNSTIYINDPYSKGKDILFEYGNTHNINRIYVYSN